MSKTIMFVLSDELIERLLLGLYQMEGPVSVEGVVRDDLAAVTGYLMEVDDGEFDVDELEATDSFVETAIGGMVQ